MAERLPAGLGWQFEAKWDGFRWLVFRGHSYIELTANRVSPLARYLPEMADSSAISHSGNLFSMKN